MFEPTHDEKAAEFLSSRAFANNVISEWQMEAYGSYKAAVRGVRCNQVWLPHSVDNDTGHPFVECGHA